ncbi:MAG: AI-2E family transporter [Myxococcota bacterium]
MIQRRTHSSSATPGARRRRRSALRTRPLGEVVDALRSRARTTQSTLLRQMLWGSTFVIVGLALLWLLRPVLAVLAGSAGIAYVLDPVVDWLEDHRFSREGAIGLVFTALIVSTLLFFLLIVPSFVNQGVNFANEVAPFFQNLDQEIDPLLTQIEALTGWDLHPNFADGLDDLKRFVPLVQEYAGQIRDVAFSTGQGLFVRGMDIITAGINIALMPVFIFYLLRDWDEIVASVGSLIPLRFRPRVTRVMTEVDARLAAFVRGQITVSLALAVLYSAGLLIVNIDLAVPVGVLSGVLFIIPYLGTAIGVVLAGILSIMKFGVSMNLVWTMLVFVIVQTFEGYVLTPKIVGDQVGLSPLVVMVALIVGGSLMGIWGMLLAIPITAILSVLGAEWLQTYFDSDVFNHD